MDRPRLHPRQRASPRGSRSVTVAPSGPRSDPVLAGLRARARALELVGGDGDARASIPELCAFPELALFRKDTVDELLTDPPGWRGSPTRLRLAGVFRALAEHHDGEQTPETVDAAVSWLEERRAWSVGDLLDHLLALAAPRIGVEKSPESSSRDEYLARLERRLPARPLPPSDAPSRHDRRPRCTPSGRTRATGT